MTLAKPGWLFRSVVLLAQGVRAGLRVRGPGLPVLPCGMPCVTQQSVSRRARHCGAARGTHLGPRLSSRPKTSITPSPTQVLFNAFFVAYLASPKLAHSLVGYIEEEAVKTYTHGVLCGSCVVG